MYRILLLFLAFSLQVQAATLQVENLQRTYTLAPCKKGKLFKRGFIFLHGLKQTQQQDTAVQEEMLSLLSGQDLLLIFPEGLKETFPAQPNAIGWGPECSKENLHYLSHLLTLLQKKYGIEQFVLGGFSNGGYFAASLLLKGKAPFVGYWIQGGGATEIDISLKNRHKAVLEIGQEDKWHLAAVRALKNQLLENGWTLNQTLLYRELPTGHILNLSYLKKDLDFLFD